MCSLLMYSVIDAIVLKSLKRMYHTNQSTSLFPYQASVKTGVAGIDKIKFKTTMTQEWMMVS